MSNCDTYIFASFNFLSNFLNTITILGSSIHIFCIYSILENSYLNVLKFNLITYHAMVLQFHYLLTALDSPYLMLPAIAGAPFGAINFLGTSCEMQCSQFPQLFYLRAGTVHSFTVIR
ncbi:hypothetical protein L3Y34_006707 [Caenorhabditis briggsae]|uniref:Uncharacterized protein n=1 Tax=Caenorhabditis briggsae TaxID=6238 RepID=A0AAE9CZ69_CAEBR|nr:hypothetical protein L3Y34_006707 [Caenorhabditis briggsae]